MENKKKIIEFLLKAENPYLIKVEDMIIEMKYSENNKKFNECILNILKHKKEIGWYLL